MNKFNKDLISISICFYGLKSKDKNNYKSNLRQSNDKRKEIR